MSPDLDVKTVMDTWTLQMGFPLVTVTRDYEAGAASVSQARFLVGDKRPDQAGLSWWVPITFTDPQVRSLLGFWEKCRVIWNPYWGRVFEHLQQPLARARHRGYGGQGNAWCGDTGHLQHPADWVLQVRQDVWCLQTESQHFRVNYDKRNWQLIAEQLNRDHTKIHVINRWIVWSLFNFLL